MYFKKHVPDAHTALYYSFENDTYGNYNTFVDSVIGGGWPADVGGSPGFVVDSNDQPYARSFSATTDKGTASGDPYWALLLSSSWTVECWANPTTLAGGTSNCIIEYIGNGESLATNTLMSLRVTPTGKMYMFWEYGAGTNMIATSSNSNVVTGSWTHLAVVKRDAGGGNLYYVDFYQDGVLKDAVGPVNNASGGLSDEWWIGNELGSSNERWRGSLRSLRLSNCERSASEISASASTGSRMHVNDGNTMMHYKFTEWDDRVVDGGYLNQQLKVTGYGSMFSASALTHEVGLSRYCNGTLFMEAQNSSSQLQQLWSGTFTAMVTVQPKYGFATVIRDLFASGEGFGEAKNLNWQMAAVVNTDFSITGKWEKGLGTDVDACVTNTGAFSPYSEPTHLAFVKKPGSTANKNKMDIYVDGVCVKTGSDQDYTEGGELAKFRLGKFSDGSSTSPWLGFIDEFVLVDYPMTAAQIAAYVVTTGSIATTVKNSLFNWGLN